MDPAAERLAPLLSRLVNYERTRPTARAWDLATMQALLARPGAGKKKAPAVQVGGSKGKGTTCAFLDAFAAAAGLRAGVYLSPHTETLRERIRMAGELVSLDQLERALQNLLAFADAHGLTVSFFEAMTAAAVDLFAAQRVELAIWEVGLGGRFDATTAVPVDASVVTGIELEHTELLGDTVAAIAAEKAPVVRPGGLGFTAATGLALAVLERHASSVGARLSVFDRDFGFAAAGWNGLEFRGRLRLPDGSELPVRLPDARVYELPALALAAAVFRTLLPGAPLRLDPSPRPLLPCRFEILPAADGTAVVLDGAHTENSLAAVAVELQRRWPGRPFTVLFGSATGKRWREGLRPLLRGADRFFVTELTGTASEDPVAIAQWLREHGARTEVTADVANGL
ncbi:MAG TPA: hypothetical protein VK348_08985, partial [Planctomycetota bacterium]|nr:hypothetical protein [Planctomycetota bacterium]